MARFLPSFFARPGQVFRRDSFFLPLRLLPSLFLPGAAGAREELASSSAAAGRGRRQQAAVCAATYAASAGGSRPSYYSTARPRLRAAARARRRAADAGMAAPSSLLRGAPLSSKIKDIRLLLLLLLLSRRGAARAKDEISFFAIAVVSAFFTRPLRPLFSPSRPGLSTPVLRRWGGTHSIFFIDFPGQLFASPISLSSPSSFFDYQSSFLPLHGRPPPLRKFQKYRIWQVYYSARSAGFFHISVRAALLVK